MTFEELIHPLNINDFSQRVSAGRSFLIKNEGQRDISKLISLDDIERAINSGCNLNTPVQVIKNGSRNHIAQDNLYWSPLAVQKSELKNLLEHGHSVVMMNMSQVNPQAAQLISNIENTINGCHADLHLYVSPQGNSTGYLAHRDRPQHKIFMQMIGQTHWQLFSHSNQLPEDKVALSEEEEKQYLQEQSSFVMQPGDVLYMPPNTFHKVKSSSGPRISFSIPFVISTQNPIPQMDRTFIPFKSIFEKSLQD